MMESVAGEAAFIVLGKYMYLGKVISFCVSEKS